MKNGLTTTSANYLANIAKETYRMMEDTLNNYSFYTKKISLIGSDIEKKTISLALNNYCNSMNLLNAEIKAYKDTKITEAQSLKIIIPDTLKSIYNQLSNMGKE